jgi:hypothetical protein
MHAATRTSARVSAPLAEGCVEARDVIARICAAHADWTAGVGIGCRPIPGSVTRPPASITGSGRSPIPCRRAHWTAARQAARLFASRGFGTVGVVTDDPQATNETAHSTGTTRT